MKIAVPPRKVACRLRPNARSTADGVQAANLILRSRPWWRPKGQLAGLCLLGLSCSPGFADNLDDLAAEFEATVGDLAAESNIQTLMNDTILLAADVDFESLVSASMLVQLRKIESQITSIRGTATPADLSDILGEISALRGSSTTGEQYDLGDLIDAINGVKTSSDSSATVSAIESSQGTSSATGNKFTYEHILASQAVTASHVTDLTAEDFTEADDSTATYDEGDYEVDTSTYSSEATDSESSTGLSSLESLTNSSTSSAVTDQMSSMFSVPDANSSYSSYQDWGCVTIPTSMLPAGGFGDSSVCLGSSSYTDTVVTFIRLLILCTSFFFAFRIVTG